MKYKLYKAGMFTQALLYVAAGANHFVHTETYVRIMPPHYSRPAAVVLVSGVAEVLGGLGLLMPATRRAAAAGIVAMLVVYFDVHLYMAENTQHFASIPAWAIYARIPLQFVLIAWAWRYTRKETVQKA